MSLFNLKNKSFLITGSSKGIGKSIVKDLSKHGSHVIVLARTKSDLQKVKNELKKPNSITTFQCDVTSHSDIKNTFKKIKKKYS